MADEVNHLEDARASLKRVLDFDIENMHRENDLGTAFSFRSAIAPTKSGLPDLTGPTVMLGSTVGEVLELCGPGLALKSSGDLDLPTMAQA